MCVPLMLMVALVARALHAPACCSLEEEDVKRKSETQLVTTVSSHELAVLA